MLTATQQLAWQQDGYLALPGFNTSQEIGRAPNGANDAPTFQITTTPNPKQQRALELIGLIQL